MATDPFGAIEMIKKSEGNYPFLGLMTVLVGLMFIFGFKAMNTLRAETVYKFGVVPQFEPRKLADIWMPILAELSSRTGLKFEMVGSSRIGEFERSFLAGEYHFAYMNPYHALLASSNKGYVPLVRDHGRKLSGILVVRKDSKIKNVEELNGKSVAFPSPNALGASLLMRADLEKREGVHVKPIYVQTHSSVYLNVLLNKTVSGGGVMGSLRLQSKDVQDGLRVLYKTREMMPHPVVAHPNVNEKDRQLVRNAFLAMGETEQGAALLAKVPFKKVGEAGVLEYLELQSWGLDEFFVNE
ncbi:MAG: phosphonate transport system substrate-binding protein [Candidatus Azotimanducaceae bacterium]|jgi:phosphonate transport system substrate-binding protein